MLDILIDISVWFFIHMIIVPIWYIHMGQGVWYGISSFEQVLTTLFHYKFPISWILDDTFSIHINFFMQIQWNGSRYLIFGYLWSSGKVSIFQKACFLEIKEYALNTSLKKRIFPIEIVKIDIWMIIPYLFNYCCHIINVFYMMLYFFKTYYMCCFWSDLISLKHLWLILFIWFLYIRIEAARSPARKF